jgi:hypothetical protein
MRIGTWLASLGLIMLFAQSAGAVQIPPGCTTDGVVLDISKSATAINNGDIVTFTVILGNPIGPGNCDSAALVARGFCPDGAGQPTILTKTFATIADLPVNSPIIAIGTFQCVMQINPGVTTAIARATVAGILFDNPIFNDALLISKDLSVLVASAPPPPTQIPTLSGWTMIVLAGLLVGTGAAAAARGLQSSK